MTLAELAVAASDFGLNADGIIGLARAAVVWRPQASLAGEGVGSWVGGLPALPRDMAWPTRDGRALAFVAQIACDELPDSLAQQGFPARGALYFFYDAAATAWESNSNEASNAAVVYVADPAGTSASEWPDGLPESARYDIQYLTPHETIALPPVDSSSVRRLRLIEDQDEAYQQLVDFTAGEDGWTSRMLLGGHPDQIQEDMTAECAVWRLKAWGGEPIGRDSKGRPNLREQALHWRLLLQVPTIEALGMTWGDAGCLYYWIHEEDLKACRFDRICVFLQSH
jgi:uncharacterized protein YwqG